MPSLSPTSTQADISVQTDTSAQTGENNHHSGGNSGTITSGSGIEEHETIGSLENSLIKSNRLLNHQVVTLKNKQQELVTLQQKLKTQLTEKDASIDELNLQLNKFLNEDNYGATMRDVTVADKDDADNQSVRSSFSTSIYSVKSLLNGENEHMTSHNMVTGVSDARDPNKIFHILITQRDMLKQKLKKMETNSIETKKHLDKAQLENFKLKQQLEQSIKLQKRHSSVMSQEELKRLSTLDLEGQYYGGETENGDYAFSSRKYSNYTHNNHKFNLHSYIETKILKSKFRRGLAINYFILLHLAILLVLVLHPLRRETAEAEEKTGTNVSFGNLNSNLPPSGGKVMHAPGKGNAEQAAKEHLL